MLRTWLTDRLGIRYPVISASMTGVAYGRLARAVSQAGGLSKGAERSGIDNQGQQNGRVQQMPASPLAAS